MMCKRAVEPERAQMRVRRVGIACWIIKATNTQSECLILIAYPQQQWLQYTTLPVLYYFLFGKNLSVRIQKQNLDLSNSKVESEQQAHS
jgi:hypothetical protein